jgi:hypothetical protein
MALEIVRFSGFQSSHICPLISTSFHSAAAFVERSWAALQPAAAQAFAPMSNPDAGKFSTVRRILHSIPRFRREATPDRLDSHG